MGKNKPRHATYETIPIARDDLYSMGWSVGAKSITGAELFTHSKRPNVYYQYDASTKALRIYKGVIR